MHKTLIPALFLALLALSTAPVSAAPAIVAPAIVAPAIVAPDSPPYYSTQSLTLPDGRSIEETIIAGPAHPPAGYVRTAAVPDAESPLGSKT